MKTMLNSYKKILVPVLFLFPLSAYAAAGMADEASGLLASCHALFAVLAIVCFVFCKCKRSLFVRFKRKLSRLVLAVYKYEWLRLPIAWGLFVALTSIFWTYSLVFLEFFAPLVAIIFYMVIAWVPKYRNSLVKRNRFVNLSFLVLCEAISFFLCALLCEIPLFQWPFNLSHDTVFEGIVYYYKPDFNKVAMISDWMIESVYLSYFLLIPIFLFRLLLERLRLLLERPRGWHEGPKILTPSEKAAIVGILAFVQGSSMESAYSPRAKELAKGIITQLELSPTSLQKILEAPKGKPEDEIEQMITILKKIKDEKIIKDLYKGCLEIATISSNSEIKLLTKFIFREIGIA